MRGLGSSWKKINKENSRTWGPLVKVSSEDGARPVGGLTFDLVLLLGLVLIRLELRGDIEGH